MSILEMKPVGHYAYGIHFADGHDTGIYTFEFLRSLGHCRGRLKSCKTTDRFDKVGRIARKRQTHESHEWEIGYMLSAEAVLC